MGFGLSASGIGRGVAIGLLIASLIHIPLPQLDFHNVRHHDAPGEACVYHDHLLRWHPAAGRDVDASILHWHWVLPNRDGSGDSDDGSGRRPDGGPAFHAQNMGDGLEPAGSAGGWFAVDRVSVPVERVSNPSAAVDLDGASFTLFESPPAPRLGFRPAAPPCALSALRPILQRWNC